MPLLTKDQVTDLPERRSLRPGGALPLLLEAPAQTRSAQPVRVGVPLTRGMLDDARAIELVDAAGQAVACQGQALARWSDGSVRWLLLDFVAGDGPAGEEWSLHLGRGGPAPSRPVVIEPSSEGLAVDTGVARFRLNASTLTLGADQAGEGARWVLIDRCGVASGPQVERLEVEAAGPVRATVRVEGHFRGRPAARFVARLSFHAGTALVRIDLTLHNPNRARHPGGLWDLGDEGSLLLRDLSLEVPLNGPKAADVTWTAAPGSAPRSGSGPVEIYQGGSGGENWQSVNHVNREGRVPCSLRGYRICCGGSEETGLRASPVLSASCGGRTVTVAVADFWQQFPKALEVAGNTVRVQLFPAQFGDLYELQGGEQKTHTVWLDVGSQPGKALDWVAAPLHAHLPAPASADSGALAHLAAGEGHEPFERQVAEVLGGPAGFVARREVIDEYGWRHYGEVFADHEEEHYPGPGPFVSHYNNQYDIVLGLLQQYFRGGDPRWLDLAGPLARHVCDVDVYHTTQDRAAYSGGMFWFTDHYLTAHTCTHRTYTRHNRPPKGDYGGGPSTSHLFSTGLLLYHYATGDPVAHDVVLELADWVLRMEDGSRNLLGLIDAGPTGLASNTGMGYQGPGRGAGNAINTLLDAWLLSGRRHYLDAAEKLIRRTIHPEDDVAARNLLDVEKRWSYTVHLAALARYLEVKAEVGERDLMYAYARAALLGYASWMLEHEVPYFDRPEQLEFPTEAWAGQELRKANVLRLAAEHAEEPLRTRLLARGGELADRAWTDLYRFASRTSARGQALVMAEGPRDDYFRRRPAREMPAATAGGPFPPPADFVPQKQRVLARLRSPLGLAGALLGLLDLRRWGRLLAARSGGGSRATTARLP